MKRLLLILLIATSYQLHASTPQIEGLYVWNPGKSGWMLNPDKRKNSEPSQVVWDSLLISPDSSYTLKSSRFYDVGGKIVKDTTYGTWSHIGDFVAIVPYNANYSCVPNTGNDSIISVYISKIKERTRDTIPIENGTIYVCSETGVTKYYVDNAGYIDIKYSSIVWAIYIESNYSATIPFPRAGCRYNVTLPCYGIRNIGADLFKVQGADLWECFIHNKDLCLGSQYKKSIKKTNKGKTYKRLREHNL